MANVLVVDDEPGIRAFLEILLGRLGHKVRLAEDAPEAILRLKESVPDLVLCDLRLPSGSGMDVLLHVQRESLRCAVIMMTAFATTENAIGAMKAGAYDYVIKPVNADELTVLVGRALEHHQLQTENVELKKVLSSRTAQSRLIGQSAVMREVFELIGKVAPTRTNVLLTGESGTGKELVARAIHNRGPREGEPFVPINCGAIPETLIESELFGHKKGAFTGATSDKMGLFEAAGKGSVFLDEIGELPLAMQVKLLRVLQERKIRKVGDSVDIPVTCRVISATNRDLEIEVTENRFREDLYFRLNVIQLRLPSLRERRGDVPLLVDTFIAKFAEEQMSPVTGVSDAALRLLAAWNWPGNVRELENCIERGITFASGDTLDVAALPKKVREHVGNVAGSIAGSIVNAVDASGPVDTFDIKSEIDQPFVSEIGAPPMVEFLPEEGLDLESTLETYEKYLLKLALERTGGKKTKAAEVLKLSFRSFRYRLAKLGIDAE